MNTYASCESPMIGDIVECVEDSSCRKPYAFKAGQQGRVTAVYESGYFQVDGGHFASKPCRYNLIRRASATTKVNHER